MGISLRLSTVKKERIGLDLCYVLAKGRTSLSLIFFILQFFDVLKTCIFNVSNRPVSQIVKNINIKFI
jgi:hypothetical protein